MAYRLKAFAVARTPERGDWTRALRVAFGMSAVAGILANAALLVLATAGAL